MKIAILTVGSRGDTQPYIALGKALQARGHEVVLAAPDNFAAWVEGHGLAFRPMGIDIQAFIQSSEARQIMAGNVFALARIWRRTVVPMMRGCLDASWEAARDAEVIVYHPKAGGAVDITEATGAALICAAPLPMFPTGAFPLFGLGGDYGPRLNRMSWAVMSLSRVFYRGIIDRWRKEALGLGKGPVFLPPGGFRGGMAPRLCAVSPAVLPGGGDTEPGLHITGYWFLDEGRDWQPDPALAAFLEAGERPVYVGFGSMTTRDPVGLAKAVVEGVRQAGLRAILATGWGGMEQITAPETVHVIDGAPHEALFRYVSAVVHHGGAGTTAAGLRAGLPTLICPLSFDQPFWGRRVQALGCGPEFLRLKHLTAERFAQRLGELTRTESYRLNAAKIARLIAREDGIGRAIEVIEAQRRIQMS